MCKDARCSSVLLGKLVYDCVWQYAGVTLYDLWCVCVLSLRVLLGVQRRGVVVVCCWMCPCVCVFSVWVCCMECTCLYRCQFSSGSGPRQCTWRQCEASTASSRAMKHLRIFFPCQFCCLSVTKWGVSSCTVF